MGTKLGVQIREHVFSAFILAEILLLVGAPGVCRADNVLEANGPGQNLTSVSRIYSTSTAQPDVLAIHGGTIVSINDLLAVLPPGGETGMQAEGIASKITAQNPSISALGIGLTGIVGASAIDGGVITLDGGQLEIASGGSIGLSSDDGTVSAKGGLTISMTGVDSRGVEADATGLVEINPGTTITTTGAGGFGIFATTAGTVTANGVAIITSGLLSPDGFNADGAAALGGTINLANSRINTSGLNADGLHAFDPNSKIFGTNLTILTSGGLAAGAEADNGGSIQLAGGSITTTNAGSNGLLATAGGQITAAGIDISTQGAIAHGALAETGGIITVQNSTITVNGPDANGLSVSGPGSRIALNNSNVVSTQGNGASVDSGASLTLSGSSLTALFHGIVATGGTSVVPNSIVFSSGNLTTVLGDAFQVQSGVTNITVNGGATVAGNSSLLRVLDPPSATVVNFDASHATLVGDIFTDPGTQTTVNLANSSVLTGRVNPLSRGLGVQMSIDGSSEWLMTGNSNVESLSVSPGATAVFRDPLRNIHNTLSLGSLSGTGGVFGMNIDLRHDVGDLVDISGTSQGSHMLNFFDLGRGTDLRGNQALLVVETADGIAGFSGMTDRAVFKYYVVHGDGSSATPNPDDWYLVRADRIRRDQVIRSPDLPAGSIGTPVGLSTVEALSNPANAAIGTYSAGVPLFYADMDTLIQRLGELRLQSGGGSVSVDSNGKGMTLSTPPEETSSTIGTWARGFGNGMHINDQVSRAYDQNTGGFQLGADKSFAAFHGDLYVGGFLGYFNASRDFLDGGNGSTNALSFGAYATWIHPKGWYADLVLKYTQLWNYYNTPASDGSSTANYTNPSLGGSLEVGKRFDFGKFFIEPQAQLAGAWEGGSDYTDSSGLMVGQSDQYSLRGRIGLRAGMHLALSNGVVLEPYLKVSAIHEFLTGDQITTDEIGFNPSLSGTFVDAAAGLTTRVSQSVNLYAEYDYADGDKLREPWAVNAGVQWKWGGKPEEAAGVEQPPVTQSDGKQEKAPVVEQPPAKTTEPWQITIGGPGWLANASGHTGFHGVNPYVDVGIGQILKNINAIYATSAEVQKGRFGLTGGLLYLGAQAGTPQRTGLVSKLDVWYQQFFGQLFASYRVIEGPRGWVDLLGGFRYTYLGDAVGLQANNMAIDAASTQLVDQFAQQLATSGSDVRALVQHHIIDELGALDGHHPKLPVGPVAESQKGVVAALVEQLLQSQQAELAAAIRTGAQARVNQLKAQLSNTVAKSVASQLNRSFSFYESWTDPLIGLRGRFNLSKAFYLTAETDVGGFGVGSDVAVDAYAAFGCQITRNIFSEIGYRYLYDDFRDASAHDFLYQMTLRGVQLTAGIKF